MVAGEVPTPLSTILGEIGRPSSQKINSCLPLTALLEPQMQATVAQSTLRGALRRPTRNISSMTGSLCRAVGNTSMETISGTSEILKVIKSPTAEASRLNRHPEWICGNTRSPLASVWAITYLSVQNIVWIGVWIQFMGSMKTTAVVQLIQSAAVRPTTLGLKWSTASKNNLETVGSELFGISNWVQGSFFSTDEHLAWSPE